MFLIPSFSNAISLLLQRNGHYFLFSVRIICFIGIFISYSTFFASHLYKKHKEQAMDISYTASYSEALFAFLFFFFFLSCSIRHPYEECHKSRNLPNLWHIDCKHSLLNHKPGAEGSISANFLICSIVSS